MFQFKSKFNLRDSPQKLSPKILTTRRFESPKAAVGTSRMFESPSKRLKLSPGYFTDIVQEHQPLRVSNGLSIGSDIVKSSISQNLTELFNAVRNQTPSNQTLILNSDEDHVTVTKIPRVDVGSDSTTKDVPSDAPLAPLLQNQPETPPQTPVQNSVLSHEFLTNQKTELIAANERIINEIALKYEAIQAIKTQENDLLPDQRVVCVYNEIASTSQKIVRDLINQIHNPGELIGRSAMDIVKRTRDTHKKNFEHLSFELSNDIESAATVIDRKIKHLQHAIQLHKRTLITLECQKQKELERQQQQQIPPRQEVQQEPISGAPIPQLVHQLNEQVKEGLSDNTPDIDSCAESEHVSYNAEESGRTEDDCIIIDDEVATLPVENTNVESNNDNCACGSTTSETTATLEAEEDEQTDIDDGDGQNEASFTPCQAQRPA